LAAFKTIAITKATSLRPLEIRCLRSKKGILGERQLADPHIDLTKEKISPTPPDPRQLKIFWPERDILAALELTNCGKSEQITGNYWP